MNIFEWNELQIFTFFHELVRVSSFLVFLPIFGDKVIPAIVKILFGLALTVVMHPILWSGGYRIDPQVIESTSKLILSILGEITLGVLTGYIARWAFDALQFAGNFAATSMGFSMASVFDPHSESQGISYSELVYVLASMLFLAMDGHHIYLSTMLESFKHVPMAGVKILNMSGEMGQYLIRMTSEVLLMGIKLSAPVAIVIFIINLTFGVVARAVPQMNVLVVSFAANIMIGLFVSLVSLPSYINMVEFAFETYTPEILKFMKILGA